MISHRPAATGSVAASCMIDQQLQVAASRMIAVFIHLASSGSHPLLLSLLHLLPPPPLPIFVSPPPPSPPPAGPPLVHGRHSRARVSSCNEKEQSPGGAGGGVWGEDGGPSLLPHLRSPGAVRSRHHQQDQVGVGWGGVGGLCITP